MTFLTLLTLPLSACGGAGTLEGDVFHSPEVRYRIGSLESPWRRVDVEGQNDLAWTHADLAAVIQTNSSCNPGLDIPLPSLTNHLLIGFTDREFQSQETVPMASREALRTHVTAKLDGVSRELLFVVLKKDGCVYDFSLVAPPGPRFERARPDFDRLVAGFESR